MSESQGIYRLDTIGDRRYPARVFRGNHLLLNVPHKADIEEVRGLLRAIPPAAPTPGALSAARLAELAGVVRGVRLHLDQDCEGSHLLRRYREEWEVDLLLDATALLLAAHDGLAGQLAAERLESDRQDARATAAWNATQEAQDAWVAEKQRAERAEAKVREVLEELGEQEKEKLALVQELAASRWIPVGERLPEIREASGHSYAVQAYRGDHVCINPAYYIETGFYELGTPYKMAGVTHWRDFNNTPAPEAAPAAAVPVSPPGKEAKAMAEPMSLADYRAAAQKPAKSTGKPAAKRKRKKAPGVPDAPNGGRTDEETEQGRDTPEETAHPPGHRARYAIAQGGGLPYAGCRLVFDDIAPADAQQLAAAARGLGIRAY